MKKNKNFLILLVLSLITMFASLTCKQNVGLGGSVDIKDPKGKIQYPGSDTVIKGSFDIKGTASDDEGVKSVSLVLVDIENKRKAIGPYSCELEKIGGGAVNWKVTINNAPPLTGAEKVYPIPDGEYEAIVTITDKTSKIGILTRTFKIDNTAPEIKVVNPEPDHPQAGKITVSGSILDIPSGVDESKTMYIIGAQASVPSIDTPLYRNTNDINHWRPMSRSTAKSWSFDVDLASISPSQYGTKEGNYYRIPFYVLTEDKIGNKEIHVHNFLFDPDGKKPIIEVLSPQAGARLGGTIQIFGTSNVAIGGPGDVGEVYIQFSRSGNFDGAADGTFGGTGSILSKDWYSSGNGQAVPDTVSGGANWRITINGDGSFNPTSGSSHDIYFRLRAKNKDGTQGGWSNPIKITVDKDAPTIGSPKAVKVGTKYYLPNMWVKNGEILKGSLNDASGLKSVEIKSDDLEGGINYDLNKAKERGWVTDAGGGNYELNIPFNFNALSAAALNGGGFSVRVRIVENTDHHLSAEQTFSFKCDKIKPVGDYGKEKGLPGIGYFYSSSFINASLANEIKHAPRNYKILIKNNIVNVTGVSGNSIEFSPEVTAGTYNYIVYEPVSLIYADITGNEWVIQGVANDDGAGIEKVEAWIEVNGTSTEHTVIDYSYSTPNNKIKRTIDGQVIWEGSIKLDNVADGKGVLKYKITDRSGNEYEGIKGDIYVKNKPVQIKKLVFKSDLSGYNDYESGEMFTIENFGQLNTSRDFEGVADVSSNFTFKNPTKSELEVTLKGGYGTNAKISLHKDSFDGEIIAESEIAILDTEYNVTLDLNGRLNIGDDQNKKLFLKVTDGSLKPVETPWHGKTNITVGLEVNDNVKPTGVIMPFFYNSDKTTLTGDAEEKLSSVKYEGGKPAGHIEISGVGALGNTHPCVSGKVILRGIAYDNIRLKKLELSGAGISVSNEFTANGWSNSSSALKVVKNNFSNTGHYVEWEYEWTTGTPALAQEVTLKVTDDAGKTNGETPAPNQEEAIPNAEPSVQTGTRGPEDRVLTLASGDKPVKHQFIRLTDENERHYLVQINEVQENNKINWFDVNVPQNIVKYVLYTAESNNAQIKVNIVPYITKIKTKLSELGNNESVYNRTALGRYPVSDKEEITIEGFNLSGAAFELNGTALTASGTKHKIGSATSGNLIAKVGTIESINNINDDTKPYNKEPNKVNNDLLTDDRFIDVWEFKQAAKAVNGFIRYPVLKISSKDGSVGLAYANGVTYFNMAGFGNDSGQKDYKSARRFDMNWAEYVHTDFVFDEYGYTYGMATGVDMNTGDGGSGGVASYSKFVSRRPGKIEKTNNYGGDDPVGIGLRIENIGTTNDPYTVDPNRIQSPSITTVAGTGDEETFIYLAYYDTINQHIRYRWGSVAKDSYPLYHEYGGQLIDLKGYGKMQESPKESFSILAGPPAKAYPGDTGGSTQTGATNNSGKYVSLAAIKADKAGTTYDVVTAVWYNAKERSLMYAYAGGTETPRKDDVKWSAPVKISSGGEYVRSVADPDGGIHLAFYDSGNLNYAYLPKYDSKGWTVVIVDSYSLTGTHVSIDLARAKAGGKWIPYISYYMQGGASAKLAYLVDETDPEGTGAGSIKAGADTDEKFTGAWEVSIVPAENSIREDRINVGVWKEKDTAQANYGVIKAIPHVANSGSDEAGWVTGGNGTANPILGYAVVEEGAFETAQKK